MVEDKFSVRKKERKMNKELLISIAVIVAIIILDIITTNYTEHAIYILSQKIDAIMMTFGNVLKVTTKISNIFY